MSSKVYKLGASLVFQAAVLLALTLVLSSGAMADELKYTPINPAFGGNPFGGQHLMNTAQDQRQFQAPERKRTPAIEEFADTVQRTLLNNIAREISDQILGEDGQDSGTFMVGETQLEFERDGNEVVIEVQDSRSEGSTTIRLPLSY